MFVRNFGKVFLRLFAWTFFLFVQIFDVEPVRKILKTASKKTGKKEDKSDIKFGKHRHSRACGIRSDVS